MYVCSTYNNVINIFRIHIFRYTEKIINTSKARESRLIQTLHVNVVLDLSKEIF